MRKFLTNLIIFTLLVHLACPQLSAYSEDGDKKDAPKKVVYLTFDDAPGGEVTQKTLDILKEENVPAKENIIQTDTDDKAEIPLQNENNAVKPIDNTERVNVPETAVTEKIEGTYRERIEDKNDTVQEVKTEKSSLPEKDIQKMIQSAGKILRD